MNRALSLFGVLLIVGGITNSHKMLTGKEIYGANRDAVVEIGIGNNFVGDGFIVSADGLIVTANHVVTTRESRFREYASNLLVRIVRNGEAKIYPASPIEPQVSDAQVNFDSARLKIEATGLPHVSLGNWNEIEIGSQVTLIAAFPGPEILILQCPVSGKAVAATDLGPKPVSTIWFQCPVRNGFSGAPIFSSKGHVVGIVTTKVFGISPALDTLRTQWAATRSKGSIRAFGIDLSESFLDVINSLDLNLISGLGSGVDIEYSKQKEGNSKAATQK